MGGTWEKHLKIVANLGFAVEKLKPLRGAAFKALNAWQKRKEIEPSK